MVVYINRGRQSNFAKLSDLWKIRQHRVASPICCSMNRPHANTFRTTTVFDVLVVIVVDVVVFNLCLFMTT